MSVRVMSQIWDRLNVGGGELNLALALGDRSNDQGESICYGVDTMCRKTRQSRATVQRQLSYFREIDWLQVVDEGGLVGGRGRPTVYRINPDWLAGDELPQLRDLPPDPNVPRKGLNVRPIQPAKGPQSEAVPSDKGPHPRQERASNGTEKGLTAVSHNPEEDVKNPKSDGPRAIPTGSLPSPGEADERRVLAAQRAEYDLAARINHWRRRAGEWVIRECSALQIVKGRPSIWRDLPEDLRRDMAPKIERILGEIAEFERANPRVKLDTVETKLQALLTFELKQFTPSTVAEIASDRAAGL